MFCVALVVTLFKRLPVRALPLLLAIGMAMGFLWRLGWIEWRVGGVRELHEKIMPITAVVQEPPIEGHGFMTRIRATTHGRQAMLYVTADEDIDLYSLRAGDILHFTALLRVPEPDGDDPLVGFRRHGVVISALQRGEVIIERRGNVSLLHGINRFSHTISQTLQERQPQASSALAASIFLGDRSEITPSQRDNLRESGLMHVTAVSGMHVAFLMGFVLLLFGNRRWAFVPSLLIMFGFVALAGFPASAVRAAIMQAIMLVAYWRGRPHDTLTNLAMALAILLAVNPFSAGDIGLHLSFAATLGIVLFAERFKQGIDKVLPNTERKLLTRLRRAFVAGVATSLAAMQFSAPLLLYNFGVMSLLAPLATFAVLWAVVAIFLLTPLFAGLTMIWAPLGVSVGWVMWMLSQWFWLVANTLSSLPYIVVRVSDFYAVLWTFAAIAVVGVIALSRHARKVVAVGVACILCMLAVSYGFSSLDGQRWEAVITVVNVGQGQAIIVQSGDVTLLIDCGSLNANAAERTVQTLRNKGSVVVDYAVITHGHADHVNGLENLVGRIPVWQTLYPPVDHVAAAWAHALATTARSVAETTYLAVGAAIVTVLPSVAGSQEGTNETGLTVVIEVGGFAMLVTGDMNVLTERRIAGYYGLSTVEVLVAGHHGSRHSTGNPLLQATNPQASIISVGRNHFGHPHPDVLERLYNHGVNAYRTDEMGNLVIRVTGN